MGGMKPFPILLSLFSLCIGCAEKVDFARWMGKGKKCYKHVRTKEDLQDLELFRAHYEKNYRENPADRAVPRMIHFIWLGPKEFPPDFRVNMAGWQACHPDWEVKLWSDRIRQGIPEGVHCHQVPPSLVGEFRPLLEESDNYGERSDLLRLIILEKEGGVYVDHDVRCRRSFAGFAASYDFFTGLQNPGNHILKRAAVVRNSIIGCRSHHPVITEALDITKKTWDDSEKRFPGRDLDAAMARVTHRAFLAFHKAVTNALGDPTFTGIVFPAGFFNEIDGEFGLYANETMAGAWYRDEMNYYERYLMGRVHTLMKRLHAFMAIAGGLIFGNFILLILFMRRNRLSKLQY